MLIVFATLWLFISFTIGKLIRGDFYGNQHSLKRGLMLIGISFVLGITMLITILFNL